MEDMPFSNNVFQRLNFPIEFAQRGSSEIMFALEGGMVALAVFSGLPGFFSLEPVQQFFLTINITIVR